MRGATDFAEIYIRFCGFQFTHPVRGATQTSIFDRFTILVSIHAPRAGCDATRPLGLGQARGFNSRTPCGVRPPRQESIHKHGEVSIHAPRAGCDHRGDYDSYRQASFNSRTPCGVRLRPSSRYIHNRSFNSRTPCGVRLPALAIVTRTKSFQFTHPVRGATAMSKGTHK